MKHLLKLIVLMGFWSFTNSSGFQFNKRDQHFHKKICEIVTNKNAVVNIIYRLNLESEVLTSSVFDLNYENNWDLFYHCMSEKPVVIRDMDKYQVEPLRSASSLSIYFIDSYRTMRKVLALLNPKQKWKPAHCYLFIWLLDDVNTLRRFFEKVWFKNILNAVAAVMNLQEIYTFEPFTSQGFRLKILYEAPYFYDKLRNFHHFELRISMFKDSVRALPLEGHIKHGYKRVDGWVARTLVERLNASARYIEPTDRETYGALLNGTFTGSLKDIHSGLTHIGFNFRYTLDHVKPHIEELYPYKKRLLYLVVPAAEMRPEYLIFANAFTYSLWRLLLINFLLILVIFIILQKLVERLPNHNLENSPKHWRWYEIVEMFIKTQLGEPVEEFSRISSLRQFLITWILFSYVLTSVYFAKLESSFVQPIYEPELDNLKDLCQLKVPIYAFDVVFQAIKVSLEPKYFDIINKNGVRVPRNISADDFSLALVKKHKNVAIILHGELAKEVVAHSYNDETKRPSFHIVKEYLRSLTSSYVLTKGSPFIYKFQTIVSSFYEYGFINHWLEVDARQKNYYHRSSEFVQDLEEDFDWLENDEVGASMPATLQHKKKVVLNMEILQGAFYLWIAGICASCLGFATEFIYFCIRGGS
ncbi:uncharacterized protein LOC119611583 [Lucilia sericata]|uniref:uncharacterized protein LOC119611583 n=1 Tax=Lucilia sericata TaxID=13632 RepID=UPI0018A8023A|nr:uncharacterized protein LOC119611583 [Lucilia sericata]